MLGKVLYTFASLTVVFFVLLSLIIIASALQCVIEDIDFFLLHFVSRACQEGSCPAFVGLYIRSLWRSVAL